MTEATKINYTEQQTAQIVNDYQAGVPLDQIAKTLGKSVRSVVAKLSREGVYQPKAKAKATSRVTKAALTQNLEEVFQLEQGALETLQKGSYEALEALVAAITNRIN